MRLINEIHSRKTFQATVGGDLYQGGVGRERIYSGWRAEVLIVTRDPLTGKDEPIYLEGAAEDVRHVLSETLRLLDGTEELMRAKFEGR